jgi:hypothetical protein
VTRSIVSSAAMFAAALALLGCAPGTGDTTGSAGTIGSGGTASPAGDAGNTGTTGSAGTGDPAGAGGTTGTAGATGAGGTGDPTGAAGTTGAAGPGGSAGGTTGGRGGAAGSAAGSGGRGGAAGSAAGSGGRGGTAGSAAGSGGRGGAAGSAAGAGGRGGTTGTAGTGGTAAHFSFFVTSIGALRTLSGSQNGFGGDLRYGETGDGAGLRGADKICTAIAEMSMPGSGAKGWHAFLSAPAMGSSPVVNAIERIGSGPWYDRMGRLLSANLTNLMATRPTDADAAIKNDFPNENGIPNHTDGAPGCTGNACPDNHDTLTGSGSDGKLYAGGSASANPTCSGWTTAVGSAGKPRVGHSWPRGTTGGAAHWMSSLDEAGCAPGVNLVETGPPDPSNPTVGSGGGYGGFYCFAMTP